MEEQLTVLKAEVYDLSKESGMLKQFLGGLADKLGVEEATLDSIGEAIDKLISE